MALYHLSAQIISRSGARSAIAAAAYRSRSAMYDERQGLNFDYTKKKDLVHSEIMLPIGAPDRYTARETLWNEVEAGERRKDAQLAREIDVALPREFSLEQQINLVREFCREEFTDEGMIADINVHHYKDNPHAHIMLTMREVNADGFGKKNRSWNKKEVISTWRRKWAEKTNTKLLEAGFDTTIDHRSFEARGIDLIPQRHVGYNIKFVPKEYLQLDNVDVDNAREYAVIKWTNGEKIIADPDKALSYLTHQNVAFRESDIDQFLITHTLDDNQFYEAKKKMLQSKELIKIGKDDKGKLLYTTSSMIIKEKKMIDIAKELDMRLGHDISPEIKKQTLANYTLNEEQREAFRYVTSSGDISMIMGAAGTGKSYTLAAVKEAYEAEGYRVQGVALSGIAAENLEHSSGIESTTVFSKLSNWEKGRELLTEKDILVIDEVGFIGTRQMYDILDRMDQAGGKVIMTGDIEQLPAIEAGGAARGIMDHVSCCNMFQVKRQKAEWQAAATIEMSNPSGKMKEAIEKYAEHGKIFEGQNTDQAIDRLVNDWKEYTGQNSDKSSLILAYSNKQVTTLNERARAEARREGRLGEKEQTINTEKGTKAFSEGDRIIFLENNRGMDVKNGSLGTILKIDDKAKGIKEKEQEKSILVKLENGKMISFDPDQYKNIDYGYAMTVHKSQGSTVDRSFVLAEKRFDKHLTYVSMSRHREDATLYYGKNNFQSREAFIETIEKRNLKSLISDYASRRGYETIEKDTDKFQEVIISGRKYLEVPKGNLNEPITGEYCGDLQHQGKTYHRIESIDGSKKYLVPVTEKGAPERLLLNDVIYDGNSITKAPEKVPDIVKSKGIDKTVERGLER